MNRLNKAIIYTRSATDNFDNLKQQEVICRTLCKKRGLVVDSVFSDPATSGFDGKQIEFQRMLGYLKNNKTKQFSIVMTRPDRLSRRLCEVVSRTNLLEEYGTVIFSS